MEHGEDVVPGEATLGEGVSTRQLNVWLPLGLDVGGVPLGVALANKADRRRAEWILQEECQHGGDVIYP